MAKDKPKQPEKIDADALRAEVKAFAAELGFGTAAAGAFEYDDFAPEKAARKITPAAAGGKQQSGKQQSDKDKSVKNQKDVQHAKAASAKHHNQQQNNDKRKGNREQHQQQQQQQQGQEQQVLSKQEQNLDIVRNRQWVESVGPRPGEARGKSLLGKDEPTIWYEALAGLAPLNLSDPKASRTLSETETEELRQKAEALLEREAQLFEKEMAGRNAADARWLAQVRRSGTTADKVAAMSLLVTSSATGNIKSVDGLLGMMGKSGGGRQVVVAAMEALQELFLTHLLPDRKLKVLESQPLAALPKGKEGDRHLLLWAVEDAVKRRYQQYVQLLEKASTDNLDFIKEKAIKVVSRLLTAKPEGEQALLAALVNKLGDPSRKLASDAAYLLGQLLLEHPAMKPVVVREVERFVFRPGLAERGRYYSITFLNQLALSHRPQEGGSALAQKLIDIYFSLFRLLLEGKLGNAAARQQQQDESGKGGKKGGRVGGKSGKGQKSDGNGGKGQQKSAAQDTAEQQAAELDARMLSALITGVRRAFPYVDAEKVEPLVEVHSEALFKLVHTAPFTVSLQALMLMHQLLSGRNAVSDRFYRALYAVLLSEGARGASGVRGPQFMSLLVKAMRGDVSIKRVAAFAKRLLQVACHAPSNWAAGALFLLSEVLRAQPGLWAAVQQPEDAAGQAETFRDVPAAATAAAAAANDSDEEIFRDVDDSESDGEQTQLQAQVANGKAAAAAAAVDQATNGHAAAAAAAAAKWPRDDYYDMRKREPLYASAEVSCWWELLLLSKHSHPSVAAFARSILAGSPVEYGGDPLRDLGLPAFLDKFVSKKPKATPRGSSLMQPTHTMAAAAGQAAAGSTSDVSVLSGQAFAALAEADVSADQLFFHKFFNLQSVRDKQAASAKAKAARAAAADQAGLDGMAGLASDDEDELGELGDDNLGSDDLDDAEVDKALAGEEGMGDDELGDPDIGFDYDQLLDAMADDSGDGADGPGSEDGIGDEDAAAGGSSSDGDGAEDNDEEEAASESDASEPSRSSESGDDSSSDGEGWVMMEGAAGAAAAAGSGKGKEGKQKKKRKLEADGDVPDEELQEISPFDLPSPSSSEQDDQQHSSRKKQKHDKKQQQERAESPDEEDLDLDLDDIMGGSDDAADDEDMLNSGVDADDVNVAGSSSDDEGPAAAVAAGKASKKSKQQQRQKRGGKGGGGLFASADGYASYFEEYEKALAAADKTDGPAAVEAAADGQSRRKQPKQRQHAAGSKQLKQTKSRRQ